MNMDKNDIAKARAKAYANAVNTLRAKHSDDFHALLTAEYADAGLGAPRPSASIRAAQKAEREEQARLEKIARHEAAIAALKGEN